MVHAVWGTKNRKPLLTKTIRSEIIEHILSNAELKKIYVDTLNGYLEHMHCLFNLNANMSLSNAMQLIKGESSHWINKAKLVESAFD